MSMSKAELFDIFREYATKEFADIPQNDEIKEINGLMCYISRTGEVIQCSFIHNKFTYVIQTSSDEDLTVIIENLKENR